MRAGPFRFASTLLFLPAFLLPSKLLAQSAGSVQEGTTASTSVVTQPVMIHPVGLQFRDEMTKLKLNSVNVGIGLTVDTQGMPQNIHVVHSGGPEMDAKAIEAVNESRFKPAMKDGQPTTEDIAFDMKLQFYQDKDEADAALAKIKEAAITDCTVDHSKPSDADTALATHKYADAERLYNDAMTSDPSSGAAMAGMVRTTLAEGKLPEALALALKFSNAHPNDAVLLDALAELRFIRGETDAGEHALAQSVMLNQCIGLTYYDMAHYLYLLGDHASSQRELERAYWLSPENPDISRTWHQSHAVPPTADQRLW